MPLTKPRTKRIATSKPVVDLGIRITHPDRVVYPDDNITKQDVAQYYAQVADWMLPHIVDRPLNLVRCPVGASQPCFFQKHPPQGLPDVVERIRVKEKSGTATYLVVRDLRGLLALVQFGVLEFHVWGAKADDVDRPDRIVFDLDPDPTVEWARVADAAQWLREMLEALRLTSFLKTTGGKGLHVVVPIRRKYTWDEVKPFTKAIADLLAEHRPKQFISTASKAARRGKIFVDYLRNDRGSTWVAPYSTRARPGAPLSMPIAWDALQSIRSAHEATLKNASQYLDESPWKRMSGTRQSLTAATFEAVGIRLEK